MEKSHAVIVLFVSALCFSSALARKSPEFAPELAPEFAPELAPEFESEFEPEFASDLPPELAPEFLVKGLIYCDPCHFDMQSSLSTPLAGVNLTLECSKEDTGEVTYRKEGVSDTNGLFVIPVHGDHEEDFCRVIANPPTEGQCRQGLQNGQDGVTLTRYMAFPSWTPLLNSLGIMTQKVDPECTLVDKATLHF